MLINKDITKFFEHDKLELIGTLIVSAIFIIRNCDKNNYLLDEILEACRDAKNLATARIDTWPLDA